MGGSPVAWKDGRIFIPRVDGELANLSIELVLRKRNLFAPNSQTAYTDGGLEGDYESALRAAGLARHLDPTGNRLLRDLQHARDVGRSLDSFSQSYERFYRHIRDLTAAGHQKKGMEILDEGPNPDHVPIEPVSSSMRERFREALTLRGRIRGVDDAFRNLLEAYTYGNTGDFARCYNEIKKRARASTYERSGTSAPPPSTDADEGSDLEIVEPPKRRTETIVLTEGDEGSDLEIIEPPPKRRNETNVLDKE